MANSIQADEPHIRCKLIIDSEFIISSIVFILCQPTAYGDYNMLTKTLLFACLLMPLAAHNTSASDRCTTCIESLDQLSISALRARPYQSSPRIIDQLGNESSDYSQHYSRDGSAPYSTFVASYQSDGLRLYTRVDIPVTPMPSDGYPVLIFAHGWVGKDDAPGYNLGYDTSSNYGEIIDFFVDSGFVVFAPGYRGHGTVDGKPADGIEFMHSWDNGSYLMPSFYSIDVLNLMAGLSSVNLQPWQDWGFKANNKPVLDLKRVHLLAHSQGGDVALTVLAASGEGSSSPISIHSASIWSGNIPDRFTQAETFGPMGSSLQAFMSGDGSWTGSAVGNKGEVNPNFIFPWPSEWIATVDRTSPLWSWQEETWSAPTVEVALTKKYREMYTTLNQQVENISSADFTVSHDERGKLSVSHPNLIKQKLLSIGGFHASQWLTEPLALHTSDRDYYSLPAWNIDLAKRINANGGSATNFTYTGNTHSLKQSKHLWFSPADTKAGHLYARQRDLLLFSGKEPQALVFPKAAPQ